MASIDLEFNVGDVVWALIDCMIKNTRECPTCGQNVVRDLSFRRAAQGTIVGIDIALRSGAGPVFVYTCDIDGMVASQIGKVWRTKEEAEAMLDGLSGPLVPIT